MDEVAEPRSRGPSAWADGPAQVAPRDRDDGRRRKDPRGDAPAGSRGGPPRRDDHGPRPQSPRTFIRSHDGATPSFKGLYGFPASICASINEEIVHGIPSPKRVLKEGDIISVDIGVFFGGLHTDSANTWPVGAGGREDGEAAARDEGRARGGARRGDGGQLRRRHRQRDRDGRAQGRVRGGARTRGARRGPA